MKKLHKNYHLYLIIIAFVLYLIAFYQSLIISPADRLHGQFVRIMYVHVPSAWLGIIIYCIMGICNLYCILVSSPKLGLAAYALAPIGMAFTVICLVTGSLWGKPIWGAFWVWDARLTSMLLLLVLYIGYYAVWDYKNFSIKAAAIVNLLGMINIPIIKFSVDFWATLHQKSSFVRSGGIAIHYAMAKPLLLMFLASCLLAYILWRFNFTSLLNLKKLNRMLLNDGLIDK
jgi:heme exporter protein C